VDIDGWELVTKNLVVFIAFALAACEPAGEAVTPEVTTAGNMAAPVVYTVNYPLAWMADRIAGEVVEVVLPVPPTEDPDQWQPLPQHVLAYQDADLVILNGAGYAKWTTLAFLSPAKLVDTTANATDWLVPAGDVRHRHGPKGEQNNTDTASHTWLSPDLAAEQARVIAEALMQLVPGSAKGTKERADTLVGELKKHARTLGEAFENLRDRQFIFSHPVYQYIDARYSLDGQTVVWEPHEEPNEDQWQAMADLVEPDRSPIMMWEALPLRSVSDRLREMGISVVVFETGANPHPRKGYDVILDDNLANVRALGSMAASPNSAKAVD